MQKKNKKPNLKVVESIALVTAWHQKLKQ